MRQAREDAGLTQQELAARLDVSQQAVAQAERWQSNPSIDLLSRWAGATGTTLVVELTRISHRGSSRAAGDADDGGRAEG
jgi:transcriptional regulator with XRE-family HTH domain